MGLELLWHNNINPERVVTGLGFYGRSFTMKDPSCMNPGCEFTDGARGGESFLGQMPYTVNWGG
jgi:chitinase